MDGKLLVRGFNELCLSILVSLCSSTSAWPYDNQWRF